MASLPSLAPNTLADVALNFRARYEGAPSDPYFLHIAARNEDFEHRDTDSKSVGGLYARETYGVVSGHSDPNSALISLAFPYPRQPSFSLLASATITTRQPPEPSPGHTTDRGTVFSAI